MLKVSYTWSCRPEGFTFPVTGIKTNLLDPTHKHTAVWANMFYYRQGTPKKDVFLSLDLPYHLWQFGSCCAEQLCNKNEKKKMEVTAHDKNGTWMAQRLTQQPVSAVNPTLQSNLEQIKEQKVSEVKRTGTGAENRRTLGKGLIAVANGTSFMTISPGSSGLLLFH